MRIRGGSYSLRVKALVGFSLGAGACDTWDSYRESGGIGDYRIVGHQVRPGCQAPVQAVSDARCIQVLTTEAGLILQNCNTEQERIELPGELERRGSEYGLTHVHTERCVDLCAGGVSTGCTSNCPGGYSCDATALLYRATLELDTRRLYLEVTKHAEVQIPMQDGDACTLAFAQSGALEAPCSQIDEIEAVWEGY